MTVITFSKLTSFNVATYILPIASSARALEVAKYTNVAYELNETCESNALKSECPFQLFQVWT